MAYYSDMYGYMGCPNDFNGNMLQREPTHFNSYANGYSHVVPRCHICGFEGHVPAECQQRYSSTQNCFDMNFAPEHGSYHNNYSAGWPPNQNVTYGNNSPPISPFPSSYQMQGFRCGEENQHYPPQHEASTYVSEFHQEQSAWMAELKKQQQELRDLIDAQKMQLNARLSPIAAHEPQHQPQESVPTELNGPLFGQPTTPQSQAPTNDLDDEDKLSLLCLEFNWSGEDDPLRPVIITEMKKIKDGRDLVDELKKIEVKMKLSNTISSLLELELSAPEVPLDICEVPTPSHEPEQASKITTEAATAAEEKADEIEEEKIPQILEEQDSLLECTSEEEAAIEDKELEIQEYVHIVIQELDETGLSDPLDDMLASEFSTIVSQYPMPLLNVELNHDLFNSDNTYYAIDFAYDRIHVPHNPHAKITLENACFDKVHASQDYNCFPEYDAVFADPYHSNHVLYSYTYMIGYSIDDIVGLCPVTFTLCFCECILRLLVVHHPLRPHLARVDIPWDPGGIVAW